MTYLTEKGVAEWLKIGRLKGVQAESGEWRVLGRNLQVPDVAAARPQIENGVSGRDPALRGLVPVLTY